MVDDVVVDRADPSDREREIRKTVVDVAKVRVLQLLAQLEDAGLQELHEGTLERSPPLHLDSFHAIRVVHVRVWLIVAPCVAQGLSDGGKKVRQRSGAENGIKERVRQLQSLVAPAGALVALFNHGLQLREIHVGKLHELQDLLRCGRHLRLFPTLGNLPPVLHRVLQRLRGPRALDEVLPVTGLRAEVQAAPVRGAHRAGDQVPPHPLAFPVRVGPDEARLGRRLDDDPLGVHVAEQEVYPPGDAVGILAHDFILRSGK
mmetsp:Transcript_19830/g.75014  ORF Transcript_19830/g.75014 Transcript_19830/m.75014 type:complete len:260 (+) Transcript_19830:2774-3553(+)|eukprot:scaffold613_cov243-Pinguiococcus_pyrenoidosus.AAC.40